MTTEEALADLTRAVDGLTAANEMVVAAISRFSGHVIERLEALEYRMAAAMAPTLPPSSE